MAFHSHPQEKTSSIAVSVVGTFFVLVPKESESERIGTALCAERSLLTNGKESIAVMFVLRRYKVKGFLLKQEKKFVNGKNGIQIIV